MAVPRCRVHLNDGWWECSKSGEDKKRKSFSHEKGDKDEGAIGGDNSTFSDVLMTRQCLTK